MRWTNTVETVIEVEAAKTKGQWRIGDAIAKDVKDDVNVAISFSECSAQLVSLGFRKYTSSYVGRLYRTGIAFPRAERNPAYAWDCHYEAGTPLNLTNAIVALKKIKKKVTEVNVKQLIEHWSAEGKEKRGKATAEAKAKKSAAKSKKAKASEDKLAAKDQAAKAEAEKRRQAAQKEIDEASEAIKQLGSPKVANRDLDVDVNDPGALERLAIYLGITANLLAMKRDAEKAKKALAGLEMSDIERQGIAEGCEEIIAILEKITELAGRSSRRLTVHQGGAA